RKLCRTIATNTFAHKYGRDRAISTAVTDTLQKMLQVFGVDNKIFGYSWSLVHFVTCFVNMPLRS
uniref:Uncharacterized protein n=1 Tax=Anopheles funestus TaxID=62324 RepID=A0A182S2Q3_ANOFN